VKKRLDQLLYDRGLFQSREKAKEAILSNIIYCDGKLLDKPGLKLNEDVELNIMGEIMPYVSRGGLKLEKALHEFKVELKDKIMIDVGSSTGGFTDCALQSGINKVYSIDVGSNQISDKICNNPKVVVMENTDFRDVNRKMFGRIDIIVVDVSFISIKLLSNQIGNLLDDKKEVLCLIKPQFESGKDIAKKYKGVVLNKKIHIELLEDIVNHFKNDKLYCHGLIYSPIRGTKGNVEYMMYLIKNVEKKQNINYVKLVDEAFKTS
jgi:23S rRNA (cytidine1920-2'-O)/16S rRNA (cytidine1409-2'-O)-methyltransferase